MRSSRTGSVSTARRVGTIRSASPAALACGAKSAARRANSGPSAMRRPRRLERSGIQPRQVEELGEQFLERFDRRANARDQRPHLGVAHPGRERGGEEPHRMQRLAQVVARRGEKLALGPAGRLGRGARGERCLASAP